MLGSGRMGRELIAAIARAEDARLAGVWTREPPRLIAELGEDARALPGGAAISADLETVLDAADVAIDFTLPGATPAVLQGAVRTRTPLVTGVTGLDDASLAHIRQAAESVPVFHDRNMSIGIAVLTQLVSRAAAVLGPEFVAEVHEAHHVHKRDAPSGTALKLGETLAAARHADFRSVYRYAEAYVEGGSEARRAPDDIVFLVTREGENPGEHRVVLRSQAETLELTHRVRQRSVFAEGALRAAHWLVGQPAGLYDMRSFIGEMVPGGSTRKRAPVK